MDGIPLEILDLGVNALDAGSILKKMKHKEGMECVVLNAPEEIEAEFIGWFERNSTRRLAEASPDNIALLRRI